tara:strand:- start:123 stop:431 length:309 start_codon:yes stop_codon:yes gene_type:complete
MPSVKRQKHLDRQAKKLANQRTREEREIEVNKTLTELNKLGFPNNEPNIIKFKEILKDYIESGNPYKGILPLEGYGREICYYLSNNKNQSVDVMLRANSALK